MECIGCGSGNAVETLQEGFCYTCRSDDRLRELEAENTKLKEQLAEAQGKGETARVLLDEIVCALHVLDRRSIEVYGKRYTMPLKLREPIEEADKLLNGEKE